MPLFIVALHVLLCLFMILIILLQPAKGDMGAAFGGGGSGAMFGPRGPASLLQRITTVVAVMFMGTSITLALYSDPKVLSEGDEEDALEQIKREMAERKAKQQEASSAPAPGTDAGSE